MSDVIPQKRPGPLSRWTPRIEQFEASPGNLVELDWRTISEAKIATDAYTAARRALKREQDEGRFPGISVVKRGDQIYLVRGI